MNPSRLRILWILVQTGCLFVYLTIVNFFLKLSLRIGRRAVYLTVTTLSWFAILMLPVPKSGMGLLILGCIMIFWLYYSAKLAKWAAYFTRRDIELRVAEETKKFSEEFKKELSKLY